MLSLQEISDRLEIQQLFTDYSTAIDRKNIDALDSVFTPDAYIDYRVMGGIDGRYPEVKSWLKETMQRFPSYYHMIGNLALELRGDAASSRIVCFNPMLLPLPGQPKPQVMFFGLWYADQLVRTAQGWRIAERIEEKCFDFNMPAQI